MSSFAEEADSRLPVFVRLSRIRAKRTERPAHHALRAPQNDASQKYLEHLAWRIPGVIALLVSTSDGVPLLTAVNPGYTVVTQHAETKLAATFAACAEQAAKLRFGAMKFVASVFEQLTVVHINGNHVVATVLANPDANLGVVLGVAPQIAESLDSLNHEVAIIRNE